MLQPTRFPSSTTVREMPRVSFDVDPTADSSLALARQTIAPATSAIVGDSLADTFLYVSAGSGTIAVGDKEASLVARAAALVLADEEATVRTDDGPLELVALTIGPDVDRHAPMGPRALVESLDETDAQQATGARSFQILFDATNGSTRATLFAGFIPPGKAPWHYHLYDEIVWVPEGPGRLHVGDAVEELGPGSAFRLRPREVHIVENASPEAMTIIGVFTPAGQPVGCVPHA